jgi:hypothetical protein
MAGCVFMSTSCGRGHDAALLTRYFTVEGLEIVDVHHEPSTLGRPGYRLLNIRAQRLEPDVSLIEEKCVGTGGWVPLKSVFYHPADPAELAAMAAAGQGAAAAAQHQQRLLAGLTVQCYQRKADAGRGFPVIEVLRDPASSRATIVFPFSFE